ncbi:integrase core domain-containing protein [Burkholderia cepacia]|uniref:integrase core domain-containing protein n=1 Tax=Burkholderia cepacia TaxID=292 RepID=UPI0012D8F5CD|nr:integrase core domain-containing protein [Burkholderia cepacia]
MSKDCASRCGREASIPFLSRVGASTKSGAVQARSNRLARSAQLKRRAYESVSHARRSIGDYIELYNRKRPHSSLAD